MQAHELSPIDDYEKIKDEILAAIDAKRRTKNQITRHLSRGFSFDIMPFLERMITERIIVRCENDVAAAYFRAGVEPVRFWLAGGTGEAEFAEPAAAAVSPSGATKSRHKIREKYVVDEAELEKAAAELGTVDAVATRLRIPANTLYAKFRSKPELKEAFDRGRETYRQAKSGGGGGGDATAAAAAGEHPVKVLSSDRLVELAYVHSTNDALAAALGVSEEALNSNIRSHAVVARAVLAGRTHRELDDAVAAAVQVDHAAEAAPETTPDEEEQPVSAEVFAASKSDEANGYLSQSPSAAADAPEAESAEQSDGQVPGSVPPRSWPRLPAGSCGPWEAPAGAITDDFPTSHFAEVGMAGRNETPVPSNCLVYDRDGEQVLDVFFANGGSITVGFRGNVFDLQPRESDLVLAIGRIVREYETVAPDARLHVFTADEWAARRQPKRRGLIERVMALFA